MTHTAITTAPFDVDLDARLARHPSPERCAGCTGLDRDPRSRALAWLAQRLRWEDCLAELRAGAVRSD